jgi:spoIIIJ-associated protein
MPDFRFEDSTVEKAIEKAERELGVERESLDIEVIEEKNKGILGMTWGKVCTIKVTRKRKSSALQAEEGDVLDVAKDVLNRLLELSDFKGEIIAEETPEEVILKVNIDADLESLFIGRRGKNIDSYQYILNKIVENRMQERVKRIVLDCAGYRIRRKESLENMAKKAIDELRGGGGTYTFPPMQAGDRRIIHMTMKEAGFETESRGRGEEKKVVVLPAGNA